MLATAAVRFIREVAFPTAPTGLPGVELPRGAVTEIYGAGRTSLVYSHLAAATARGEFCAFIDTSEVFDPASASAAGIALNRLLWVRCGGNLLHALKATDMLAHAGGFGTVVMDMGETPPQVARRISLSSWYRLRRAVEHGPTVLIVVNKEPQVRQAASMVLEGTAVIPNWTGNLLRGSKIEMVPRKPCTQPFTLRTRCS